MTNEEALTPEDEKIITEAFQLREAFTDEGGIAGELAWLSRQSRKIFESVESLSRPLHPDAYDLIVRFETGGKAYYNKFLKRPTCPGVKSGISIGFGYDLGYNREGDFRELWGPILPEGDLNMLSKGIGLKGPGDKNRIRSLLENMRHIEVAWEQGEEVFHLDSIPRFRKILHDKIPRASEIPAKCEGALLSLVFNRGASFDRNGDRFREMREVKRLINANELDRVPDQIRSMARLWPTSSGRWGLQGRRRDEADLFEEGVKEGDAAPVTAPEATLSDARSEAAPAVAAAAATTATESDSPTTPLPEPALTAQPVAPPPPLGGDSLAATPVAAQPEPNPEPEPDSQLATASDDASSSPDDTPSPAPVVVASRVFPTVPAPSSYPEDPPPPDRAMEAAGDSSFESVSSEGEEESTEPSEEDLAMDRFLDTAGGVFPGEASNTAYWPKNDINSPEYAHLEGFGASANFELTPEVLDAAFEDNHFDPHGEDDVIVLGIRGATLSEGGYEAERRESIGLTDLRPDHVHFKCVLGFYFRSESLITLFAGSTVPCPYYMRNYYLRMNGKKHSSRSGCNMMPSGCYLSRVGTHDKGRINPAVRTTDPTSLKKDANVTVLRSTNDVAYGTQDTWDRNVPYDNIHCSYFLNRSPKHEAHFSSAGCSTVRGRKDPSDQWAKFQRVLRGIGFNKRIDYVLLTGKDYALAAQARSDSEFTVADLKRLRVGSVGAEVTKLQQNLGFKGSGYFGPSTKKALAEYQRENEELRPDGVYSPALDRQLGWEIFSS